MNISISEEFDGLNDWLNGTDGSRRAIKDQPYRIYECTTLHTLNSRLYDATRKAKNKAQLHELIDFFHEEITARIPAWQLPPGSSEDAQSDLWLPIVDFVALLLAVKKHQRAIVSGDPDGYRGNLLTMTARLPHHQSTRQRAAPLDQLTAAYLLAYLQL